MRALDRKAIRDLVQMRGQVLAICLVMACGVATLVMSMGTLESLERTLETYYEHYRFADVFAHVKRAPETLARRIEKIPGVGQVQLRIVENVTLDMPKLAEPAIGKLISRPPRRQPGLNDLYLRTGRFLEPGRNREVLVAEAFATAHDLAPGDTVTAILNGRLDELRIVGVVLGKDCGRRSRTARRAARTRYIVRTLQRYSSRSSSVAYTTRGEQSTNSSEHRTSTTRSRSSSDNRRGGRRRSSTIDSGFFTWRRYHVARDTSSARHAGAMPTSGACSSTVFMPSSLRSRRRARSPPSCPPVFFEARAASRSARA